MSSNHEALEWDIGRVDPMVDHRSVNREDLIAYRDGRLSAEDCDRIEQQLVMSAAARRELARLAGIAPLPVPPRRKDATKPGGAGFRRRSLLGLAAVAALVLAGLLAVRFIQEDARVEPLSGAVYALEVSGLADRRGAGDAIAATAYPDTEVRIRLRAVEGDRAGTHFGLFVGGESGLTRADRDPRIRKLAERGIVEWAGPARALVGGAPGTYALFAIATSSPLPEAIPLPNPDTERVGEALPHSLVYAQTLTILKNPEVD
ncbi:hypothetical protein ABI59_17850 [Acidobacteria bacterium Mor1]|nr:hypothetical protein ABI59_17850 [Acidobacteria bacterium Mor1]